MSFQENGVRAEFSCGAQGHRRMNPIFPGFVACGRNNATLIGTAAYYNGFSAKFRPIEQFHGDEESVHVHVQDRRCRFRRPLVERPMLSPKTRQVRHVP